MCRGSEQQAKKHLYWSNREPMRTLDNKSPVDLLREKLAASDSLGRGCDLAATEAAAKSQPEIPHPFSFRKFGSHLFTP